MKKLFLVSTAVLGLTIFFTWTVAQAQTDTSAKEKMFALKADLLFPALGIAGHNIAFSFTAERGFKKRHSIQLTGIFLNFKNRYWHDRYNFILEEYKFYFRKHKYFKGFYYGVSAVQYLAHYISDQPPSYYFDGKEFRIGGCVLFGYQNYYLNKKLVADVLVGWGWTWFAADKIIQVKGLNYLWNTTEIFPRAAINIGYRF